MASKFLIFSKRKKPLLFSQSMHHYRFENKLTRPLFSRISSNSSSSSNTSAAHKGGNDPREERRGEGGQAKEARKREREREKKMDGWWMVHFIAPSDIV